MERRRMARQPAATRPAHPRGSALDKSGRRPLTSCCVSPIDGRCRDRCCCWPRRALPLTSRDRRQRRFEHRPHHRDGCRTARSMVALFAALLTTASAALVVVPDTSFAHEPRLWQGKFRMCLPAPEYADSLTVDRISCARGRHLARDWRRRGRAARRRDKRVHRFTCHPSRSPGGELTIDCRRGSRRAAWKVE